MTSVCVKKQCVRRREAGFSLIEVLVSILILMFGILGMAAMQVRATQAEFESYQRQQALLLLQDMVDRVLANRVVASCYTITDAATGEPYFGTGASVGTQSTTISPCVGTPTGTISQSGTAIADVTEWSDALFGVSEQKDGDSVGVMLGARGCITDLGANVINVSIAWQGAVATGAPPANLTCGLGMFGTDAAKRRVVSASIRLASLN